MKEQLESLRQERDQPQQKQHVTPQVKENSTPTSTLRTIQSSSGWLTTGEAYTVATTRGFGKSSGTFRRALNEGIANSIMPPQLERLGLSANFDIRRQANPKDNSVRWLRFEE